MRILMTAAAAVLAVGLTAGPGLAVDEDRLNTVLEAQSDEHKARYEFRHPAETMTFFGVEPDMTVVEVLPGGGWYSKILMPYLSDEGMLIGAGYQPEMFKSFFPNVSEERLTALAEFPNTFPGQAAEFDDGATPVKGYLLGDAPDDLKGTVDMVLFIRALHNMHRVSPENYVTPVLEETYDLLKPGGIVGIIQHRAAEDMSDEWASGSAGYLKQSRVVELMEAAGFELVEASDINANALDTPTEEEIVWRLKPSRRGDEAKRAEYDAIGESDRMTLKFRKPE